MIVRGECSVGSLHDAARRIPIADQFQRAHSPLFNTMDFSSKEFSKPPSSISDSISVNVAICGMAMRFPGGIKTEDSLWDFLVHKGGAHGPVPANRYNAEGFWVNPSKDNAIGDDGSSDVSPGAENANSQKGNTGMSNGYILSDIDLAKFDGSFFSMTRRELEWLDPQQRLLLELTRECLENAGEVGWCGKHIGCYIGTWGEDWMELQSRDTQDTHLYKMTGHADAMLSNRISYEYDFKGPSMTIKTACPASLVGLHFADNAVRSGKTSSAVVGVLSLISSPSSNAMLLEQGIISPNASCRMFDAAAEGYARAEAINMVYLKRLDDALRDGNPIRAIIRATACNDDWTSSGITHPSAESHEALIRSCYRVGGVGDFGRTGFVECHGIGTKTVIRLKPRRLSMSLATRMYISHRPRRAKTFPGIDWERKELASIPAKLWPFRGCFRLDISYEVHSCRQKQNDAAQHQIPQPQCK